MSQFSELIDKVANQRDYLLSDVLMQAKVLASRLRNRSFRHWISWEINGYGNGTELPDYRVLPSEIYGEYGGYSNSYLNTPISVNHLDQKYRDRYSIHREQNGISYIGDLLDSEGAQIGMYLDGFAVNHLREHGTQVNNMILNRVFKHVSRPSYQQLLQSVRYRLLGFLLELREQEPELDRDDEAAARVSDAAVDFAMARRVYHNCTVLEGGGMRDNYQVGQGGAIGPNAKAENMNFIQVLRQAIGDSSLAELASELNVLRDAMLAESKTSEQDEAVAAVTQAEDAAKKGDARSVLGFLKKAGRWAFDVSTKIGTDVASKAVEKSAGL